MWWLTLWMFCLKIFSNNIDLRWCLVTKPLWIQHPKWIERWQYIILGKGNSSAIWIIDIHNWWHLHCINIKECSLHFGITQYANTEFLLYTAYLASMRSNLANISSIKKWSLTFTLYNWLSVAIFSGPIIIWQQMISKTSSAFAVRVLILLMTKKLEHSGEESEIHDSLHISQRSVN